MVERPDYPNRWIALFGSLAEAQAAMDAVQAAGAPYPALRLDAHTGEELEQLVSAAPANTAQLRVPAQGWSIVATLEPQWREKALAALRAISTDTAVLVPEGMTIEFLEAARSGAPDYETMRSVMDAAVAKIIMGQTASSQGTPGRLGGDDLQGEVRQDLVKADADLVCESFNRSVVRWLTEWNFPGAKPPRVWRVVEPGEDLAARAERDVKIAQLGYEPDEAYITETYGPGWKKKAVQQGVAPAKVTAGLAAEFAELPVLAALKAGHRLDQAAIAEAATHLANRYQDVIGERVEQLVNLAEETGDYDTMRVRLRELLAEAAPPQSQEAIQRAGVVARLMGLFRAQR